MDKPDLKIDYVELPAEDFAAVQKFYEEVFGWEFTSYGDDYCAFQDGKMNGGFYRSGQCSTTSTDATLVVIYARELESTLAAVQKAGGRICKEIISFPGGRRFQFLDPHGNELAVWSDR